MSDFSTIGSGALQYAQQGISRGMNNFARDEQLVAQSGLAQSGGGDLTGALVDATQQARYVEANVRALAIADQTLGTLLDVKA